MVQFVINLKEKEDRVLNVVKSKFGLKNKSEAVTLIINKYEQKFLDLKLRPEFIEEMKRIEKTKAIPFKSIKELRASIEK